MARYNAAKWMPLSANLGGTLARHDAILLHTDAGNAKSLFGWFSNPKANASCHFFVRKDGGVEQYADTTRVTFTSREGSYRSIGVETQGFGNEPWTDKQAEAIAQLLAWCHKTHGIPLRVMASSRAGEKGVGWHRLGIDGNFPAMPNILAGRKQRGGGQLWSGSRGKVCPGDDRIRQVPGIVARAKQLAGAPAEPSKPSTGGSAPSAGNGKVLSLGSTGAAVKALQAGMKRIFPTYAGKLATDGSYGPATLAAVKEFQRRVDLDPDGVAGPLTRAALAKHGVKF